MTHDPGVFLFAGGGSGGHISPGLAIAERLAELDSTARSSFLCSDRDVDRTMLEEAGVAYESLPGSPFGLGPATLLRFVRNFARSRRAAETVIRREGVGAVVALGGFVAAPVVAAAGRLRVPVTLVNLDAPPGKANRWIARQSRHVVSALEIPGRPDFAQRIVGMPVRRKAIAPGPPPECRERLALDPKLPTLLVTGASQGARSINRLLLTLADSDADAFDAWQVCHLSGPGDCRALREAYARAGIRARVEPFVHDMGVAWGAADLAVSRAGASSVAEAWHNAVPSIFMPYPYHRDRHQQRNAAPMAATGGAVIQIDHRDAQRNVAAAGRMLRELLHDAPRRREMKDCLRSQPATDGAMAVARLLLGA